MVGVAPALVALGPLHPAVGRRCHDDNFLRLGRGVHQFCGGRAQGGRLIAHGAEDSGSNGGGVGRGDHGGESFRSVGEGQPRFRTYYDSTN